MFSSVRTFFKSFSFFKGILKTIAVLIPLGLGYYFHQIDIGIPVALSIIAISPSDIPGNRKHLFLGLLLATFLSMASCFFINLTHRNIYLLLPTIFLLTFFNAYISLYGHRATMVAFAGLFSIASTFSHLQIGANILIYCGYILIGGLWYMSLVYIYLKIKPRQYSEQLLGKCFLLTADFFACRADLLLSKNRDEGLKKLINLQTNLNENYEKLRESVLDSRSKSGKTSYLQRQFLMFIELVDIFELALANPVQYDKIDLYFADKREYLQIYSDFLNQLSFQLQQMSIYIGSRKKIKLDNSLKTILLQAKQKNDELKSNLDDIDKEKLLTLRNFYIYIENQYKSIENIRTIFENYYNNDIGERDENAYRKFVSPQNYSLKRLKDHISLKSSFFRYAVRLSIIVLVGYLIGDFFSINNSYWIILTIFIIMRPAFVITKERSQNRAYGTILGGIASFAVIYFIPDTNLYLYIAIICMPMAFGLMQENYMYASIFITITAIFMFALINADVYQVIYDRLLDTIIGVLLAVLANYLIFPTWEHRTYKDAVMKSVRANIGYLQQVKTIFNTQKGITHAYKISRKEAFLALSNLNTSFQRMLQEPKFVQGNSSYNYGIIVIQQSFLSSVASLGVRLNSRKITFPKSVFNEAIDDLISLLNNALSNLTEPHQSSGGHYENSVNKLNDVIKSIMEQQNSENQPSNDTISMRETQLYWEQFNYLFALARNLEQSTKNMDINNLNNIKGILP